MTPHDPSYALLCEVDKKLINFRNTPMLVCWGLKDFVFTGAFLEQWKTRFPDAQIHAFADAGHYLLEDAADEVIPIMREFLNETSLN